MTTKDQGPMYRYNDVLNILIGFLIGSLIGTMTMLLLAPQSGKATRKQIQEKGSELRERAADMLDDMITQVRVDRKKIERGGRKKAKELFKHGQTLVIEQLDHVSEVAKAGKKVIQNA